MLQAKPIDPNRPRSAHRNPARANGHIQQERDRAAVPLRLRREHPLGRRRVRQLRLYHARRGRDPYRTRHALRPGCSHLHGWPSDRSDRSSIHRVGQTGTHRTRLLDRRQCGHLSGRYYRRWYVSYVLVVVHLIIALK